MKKELQEKLYEDFPLLYGDRNKSMRETAMCWGLDVGDGWEPLVRNLSVKLETIIEKFRKDNPNTSCRSCCCGKESHFGSATLNPGKCLAVHKYPTKLVYLKHRKYLSFKIQQKIIKFINEILGLFFYKLCVCHCDKYDPQYPRASQVKEKFGELRMYLTCGTDEMYDLIDKATEESRKVCEICGEDGYLYDDGWMVTLCEEHVEERKVKKGVVF